MTWQPPPCCCFPEEMHRARRIWGTWNLPACDSARVLPPAAANSHSWHQRSRERSVADAVPVMPGLWQLKEKATSKLELVSGPDGLEHLVANAGALATACSDLQNNRVMHCRRLGDVRTRGWSEAHACCSSRRTFNSENGLDFTVYHH